jgi:hypothetical protein
MFEGVTAANGNRTSFWVCFLQNQYHVKLSAPNSISQFSSLLYIYQMLSITSPQDDDIKFWPCTHHLSSLLIVLLTPKHTSEPSGCFDIWH